MPVLIIRCYKNLIQIRYPGINRILFYSVKVHDTLEYDVKILDREEIKITFQFFYLHVLTNDVFCLGANSTGTETFFRER